MSSSFIPNISLDLYEQKNKYKNTQKEIIQLYQNYFRSYDKAILSAPSIDKILISYTISKTHNIVTYIALRKQYAEYYIDKCNKYDKERQCLFIDTNSDTTTIKSFVQNHKNVLLSLTYDSCHVIKHLLSENINIFFIIDEFHNLSLKNVLGINGEEKELQNSLYQIINSNHKILSISASPRLYESCNVNYSLEKILGRIVYRLDLKTAIEMKYVANYEIHLPVLDKESKTELDLLIKDINTELKIDLRNYGLYLKCCYLFQGIKRFGTLKCIIYFRCNQDITDFIEYFKKINEYFSYGITIDSITEDDTKEQIAQKITTFNNYDGNSLLCNVNILDECIRPIKCNSIYITYNVKHRFKSIQRLEKATMFNYHNIKKIAYVFLWYSNIADLNIFMSAIRESDPKFRERIYAMKIIRGLVIEDKAEKLKYDERYRNYFLNIK
jgi:hypothetical protein